MTENTNRNDDRAWPVQARWNLGGHGGDVLWRCEALRAGRLYSTRLFGTQEEAEEFAMKMRHAEPDQMFSVEAIKASTVWN